MQCGPSSIEPVGGGGYQCRPQLQEERLAKDAHPSGAVTREEDGRIAPDPLAAVLPALATLGTIASIAAINWVARAPSNTRPKSRRKASAALRDLESNCLGLQDIFRRLGRSFAEPGRDGASATLPVKFGVHGRSLGIGAFSGYQQLVNDIASSLVLASQNCFDVMCAIEDGEIEPPESVYFGFGEQQERLNALIQNRATLRTSVDTGAEIAEELTRLVRELRRHQRPA